jgi:RNA polymerase sigma-70 factor (ECF subfamily)
VADTPRGAPDGELVRRFLAGDAGAATDLITRHERRVYAVCLRVLGNPDDAADAAQDALLAMIRKLDGFRGEAAFTTWLYRVAMNVCYDHLRRAKRRPVLRRDDDAPAPEPALDDHAVAAALEQVPEDFRVAIVLADVHDLPYDEIAKVLDLPVGTVKSRVHRGRIALAKALGIGAPSEPADRSATSKETRP